MGVKILPQFCLPKHEFCERHCRSGMLEFGARQWFGVGILNQLVLMIYSELDVDLCSVEKVCFRSIQENYTQTCALQVFLSKMSLKTSSKSFSCAITKHTQIIKFCKKFRVFLQFLWAHFVLIYLTKVSLIVFIAGITSTSRSPGTYLQHTKQTPFVFLEKFDQSKFLIF